MASILNISAYRFVALNEPAVWRESIRSQADALGLKGTVLLAEEGINLVLAGAEADVRAFLGALVAQAPFADLRCKESWSAAIPFGKLVVKVKPEIIRMNRPTIRPADGRAPAVDAQTLARWLDTGRDDSGRPVVTLDTRNAFEVDHGRFTGAYDWRIASFGEFPRALGEHRAELEGKTVVSYCTGGIRCEKAALLMAQAGLSHVYQLEGGILRYLEETGGRHFEGNCFVFDARGTLNDTLVPVPAL
ncbi:MAG TPA: sulfurtransferase [Burkholderiaceae bacterium]